MAAPIARRVGTHVVPGLPCGELNFLGGSVRKARPGGIRRRARVRSVAGLAGLSLLDGVCLGVLVRHWEQVRGRGGSCGLAGPRAAGGVSRQPGGSGAGELAR